MRLVYAFFILLRILMTSAQCQETAEDLVNKGLDLKFYSLFPNYIIWYV